MRVLSADHHSSCAITMAADIFGRAMHHDIEAVFKWFEEVGRGEGAVNHTNGSHLARGCADGVQINQFDKRVGERFRVDVIYAETLSNPLVKLIDLDAISAAAREVGAVSVVDSTFTTPYLLKPLEHGFDIVVHSATKYIGGHGDCTAGVMICAQNAHVQQAHTYATMLGAMLGPFDAFLVSRGMKTLPLRMERQCDNAFAVARYLQQHPAIERVYYPGLADHPQHELATRLFRRGRFGGLLAFELKEQSRAAAFRFMDKLQLCLPATTLGDVYTELSYPPM